MVADCLAGRIDKEGVAAVLPEIEAAPVPTSLCIVACGTSFHAGLWGMYLLEKWAGIPTRVEIASEFRYREPLLGPGDTVLAISQSGETADTLACIRLAKERGAHVIGLCNVVGSSVAREADVVLHTQAGPEISVASTKAMAARCWSPRGARPTGRRPVSRRLAPGGDPLEPGRGLPVRVRREGIPCARSFPTLRM